MWLWILLFLTANQPWVYLGLFPLTSTFSGWCQWAIGLIEVWHPAEQRLKGLCVCWLSAERSHWLPVPGLCLGYQASGATRGLERIQESSYSTKGSSSHSAKCLLWDTPTLPRHIPNTGAQHLTHGAITWATRFGRLNTAEIPICHKEIQSTHDPTAKITRKVTVQGACACTDGCLHTPTSTHMHT